MDETARLRVHREVQLQGFGSDAPNRGDSKGRERAIGLACVSGSWILHHPYFAPMHAGITAAAAMDGSSIIHYIPPAIGRPGFDACNDWSQQWMGGQVDGVIVYQAQDLSMQSLQKMREHDLAVVLMNTDEEFQGFFQVLSNTDQRIRESVRWAHELGARRIGILGLSAYMTSLNATIRAGAEWPHLPVEIVHQAVQSGDPDQAEAVDAALDALMAEKPDAIVFNSDFHVAHFLQRQNNGSLPRELGLFAFGGTHTSSSFWYPRVHYLETDLFDAGHMAYALLKEAMQGGFPRSTGLTWTRRRENKAA